MEGAAGKLGYIVARLQMSSGSTTREDRRHSVALFPRGANPSGFQTHVGGPARVPANGDRSPDRTAGELLGYGAATPFVGLWKCGMRPEAGGRAAAMDTSPSRGFPARYPPVR